MADAFDGHSGGLTGPLTRFAAVTPSDDTDLVNRPRAVLVGSQGDLSIIDEAGDTTVIPGVAAGVWHPMRPVRIRATGTTATNIRIGW